MRARAALPLFSCLVFAVCLLGASTVSAQGQEMQPVIIVDLTQGYLVGATHYDAWLDGQMASSMVRPKTTFDLYTLDGYRGQALGQSVEMPMPEVCPDTYSVPMTLSHVPQGHLIALANADFDIMPRLPEMLSASSETYRAFVADFLRSQGIADPEVHIDQIMRIDIEGDGVDEVLISATRPAGIDPWEIRAGDYSVVLIRTVQGNQGVTSLLAGNIFTTGEEFAAPDTVAIAGILDLDRDGVLEVLVQSAYYEGSSILVMGKYVDGWQTILYAGCGL